jgi:glycosyltransferase involved in cell wall biosynthesis
LNIDHKTKFAYAHRIQDYLASSRIFVSLQDRNNYPSQALLEAMACGNAIVATDVGSTSKLVDSSTGIRVNGTPEEVARALVKLLNHPSQTEQMGEAARKKVTTEHTIEKFTSYLLHDVYLPSVQISQFIQACWAFMFYCGLGILA